MEQNTPDPYCHFKSDAARERALRHKEEQHSRTTTRVAWTRAIAPVLLGIACVLKAISLLLPFIP